MIYFGTCSWKYDSWQGLIYSEQAKKNYLYEYSQKYNTVEIDQWFWSLFTLDKVSLPQTHVVKQYAQSVPDNFKFTIKVPNSVTLTHFYRKSKEEILVENPHFLSISLFDQFLSKLEPMREKIGALMFQFEYLNKLKMTTQSEFLSRFAEFIEHGDRRYIYAVESRNPNYLNRTYFQFLNDRNLSHVFLEGYYMPPMADIYSKYAPLLRSPIIIRLHGPSRSDIEAKSKGIWNRILEPKDEDLARISKIIEEIQSKNLDVYVNVNNHYEGSAPLTIQRMQRFME